MQVKLTKRTVDLAKPGTQDKFHWDVDMPGFGLKVTPKGRKVYVVQYRNGGRGTPTRRFTIGRHGAPWTVDEARKEARKIVGNVADGGDPQSAKSEERAALTVSQLCDKYLSEGCGTKKASTLATDRGRIERHIKPLLGRKRVKDITPNDVRRFLIDVAKGKTAADERTKKRGRARVTGGKGTATRTVGLLGGILAFAVAEGIRTDNPVRGVKRFPDRKSERFLSPEELARLGEAMTAAENEGENRVAIAAARALILSGCRKSEILSLKWEEIDFQRGYLNLPDSKTGQKIVPLGAPALELLASQPRLKGCPYVFPGKTAKAAENDTVSGVAIGHLVGLPRVWKRLQSRAGLQDVRLHDLRHSFASVGVSAGMGLPVVGKLLGHRDPKTTARYAHIADDPARSAADRIAHTIDSAMGSQDKREKVVSIASRKKIART